MDITTTNISGHILSTAVKRGFEDIEHIYKIISENKRGFIAGSYAAYMAAPDNGHIITPNDIDVFCTSDKAVQQILNDLQDQNYYIYSFTAIAYTLRPKLDLGKISKDIQVVSPHPDWKSFPQDIIESFDLSVSRALLVDDSHILIDEGVGSTEGKVLAVNNPLKTLGRIAKYSRRGVTFNQWELSKVLKAFSSMPDEKQRSLINEVQKPCTQNYMVFDDDYGDWYDEDDWWNGE